MRSFCLSVSCWLALAAVAGCETAPIYNDPGSKVAGWSASGTVQDAANAVDGNINTLAVAGEGNASPSLTIDLGKPRVFNMVVIDHGRNEYGFARRVAVLTSLDGQRFVQRHTAIGTRRVTTLLLITPVLARYVRLQPIVPGEKPWSLAEVYIQ